MKSLGITAILAAFLVGGLWGLRAQEGPQPQSSETVARPRKKDAAPPPADATAPADANTPSESDQPKIPSKFNRKDHDAPAGSATFSSNVTAVQVDVSVLDNKGGIIKGIPKEDFRILEDDVPQQIASFSTDNDAPMTVTMLIEFSNRYQQYWSEGWYETLTAAYGFVQTLKPEDYVAVVAYDLRPEILSDFTTDRNKTGEAMQRLRMAGFSESDLFDALSDTVDRMSSIEGRKAVLLISSGRDTFSKLTFDKARKAVQTAGVPIYAISILQAYRIMAEQYMGPIQELDFLQADSEMRTFAKESGGQAFFPRFVGEYPSIYRAISDALRNQYSLAYHPSNKARDGKYRRIKVQLVDPKTNQPLRVTINGKPVKYQIIAKQGYTAPRAVE